ncbi:MAG: glycosyltransferase, partial [Bacteroidales bacterium]|nr:glycosyltransferase [Bacteroidales bacterium]
MHLVWIICLSLLALYILRVFIYMLGWRRVHGRIQDIPVEYPGISLVIPVRDEEENISLLLEDLAKQEYPAEAFEIIIVDDHSTDNTPEIIHAFQEKLRSLKYQSLDALEKGKKAALQKGIKAATHPLILNCDGDCRASSGWVAAMTKTFSDPRVRMVIGTVILEPDRGFFRSMQSLEFFSLTAVTAGAAGRNNPILCSAANLAYYKADYLEFIEQQPKVSESGDDIFLMLW